MRGASTNPGGPSMRRLITFLAAAATTMALAPAVATVPPAAEAMVLPSYDLDPDLVYLQAGAFDPTVDPLPTQAAIDLVDEATLPVGIVQYWLVQAEVGGIADAYAAIEAAGGTVAGAMPERTWLVAATPAEAVLMEAATGVRWVGYYQPAWRVPVAQGDLLGLADLPGEQVYRVYGVRSDARTRNLAATLEGLAGVHVVDSGGAVVDVAATSAELPDIATLPFVEWVALRPEVTLHNAEARWVSDTGIRDTYSVTLPGRLDGAGQTAAVADTGVNYARDLNGLSHIAFSDCDPSYGAAPAAAPTSLQPTSTVGKTSTIQAATVQVGPYDFEGDLDGWTPGGGNSVFGPEWTHQPGAGNGGGDAAGVDGYLSGFSATLTQPADDAVTVAAGDKAQVAFDLHIGLEPDFDFLNVQYSVDDGSSWTTAGSFTGDEDGYRPDPQVVDLPSTSGQTVLVRFQMTADDLVDTYTDGFPGVWIDNVSILTDVDEGGGGGDPGNLPDGPTVIDDCLLADWTQRATGITPELLADVVDNRSDGFDPHRKMAAYFDSGGAGHSPRDPSAHGTHVAGSVTGDYGSNGTWDGQDGMAPASRLVFQVISTPGGGLSTPTDLYDLFAQAYRPSAPASVPEEPTATERAKWRTEVYEPLTDARTHNNSYGLVVPIADLGNADALDRFVWDHEDMVVAVSASNDGPSVGTIGSPSVAKNNISSAASDNGRQPMSSIDTMAHFSSHGPTGDGRFGPDIATPGQIIQSPKGGSADEDHYLQGTSMSSPVLTGLATLVREYFWDGYGPANGSGYPAGAEDVDNRHNPSAALVKATLLNGATRMRGWYTGDEGTDRSQDGQWPSAGQGFGLANLDNSLYFADDPLTNWYQDVWRDDADAFAVSDPGGTVEYSIDVASGAPLDVTMSYTDAPTSMAAGSVGSPPSPATVNRLSLEIESPSGTVYVGNNMNTATPAGAGTDDAETIAGPADHDLINNSERVRVLEPEAGMWTVRVMNNGVLFGPQGFGLAASGHLGAITPGAPLQVDTPGAPTIEDVAVETYSADTTRITFTTNEPTSAHALVTIGGTEQRFDDVYTVEPDGAYVTYYRPTGDVETSDQYAGRPVVSTFHEILIFGTSRDTTYDVTLVATDLADTSWQVVTDFRTPAMVFQPFADDTANLFGADTDSLPSDIVGGVGWGSSTQYYVGTLSGSDGLGAFMFRLPADVDPDDILAATVELVGGHDLSSRYTLDPRYTLDLLDEEVEEGWGTQNYDEIKSAPAATAVPPTSSMRPRSLEVFSYAFQCTDLAALKETLTTQDGDGNRNAAFRLDWDHVGEGVPSWEYGFQRRSRGAHLRPTLRLITVDNQELLPTPCDPDTPAPTISDVAISEIGDGSSVMVTWDTDVPSDSRVIFREQGTSAWIQVGTHAQTTMHQVQVDGLVPGTAYEFGVRSAACNGNVTTADNDGAGWSFHYPPVEKDDYWFTSDDSWDQTPPPAGAGASQTGNNISGPLVFDGTIADPVAAGLPMRLRTWWTASASGVLGTQATLRIYSNGDMTTPVHTEVIGLATGAPGSPAPNEHFFDLQGPLAGVTRFAFAPTYTVPEITIHYASASTPSGFEAFTAPLPDRPIISPYPPPSAGATGLDLASVPTRTVPSAADLAAGTAACEIPTPLPQVTVSAKSATVTEGATASGFVFQRTGDLTAPLVIDFDVSGTATPDVDYRSIANSPGSITMSAGVSTTTLSFQTYDDTIDEPNETIVLGLTPSSAYDIAGTGMATITLVDDDEPGPPPPPDPSGPVTMTRIFGQTRVLTAIELSKASYPDGADTVLLAREDIYPDALAGGPLAVKAGGPILLTRTDELLDEVAAEIRRLGATTAILLGGTSSLTPGVEAEVEQITGSAADRIAGPDRNATAALIAARVGGTSVYVTEGRHALDTRGWPDAVAVSALAGKRQRPILLVEADRLPDATRLALKDLAVTSATIIGGPNSVSGEVEAQIEQEIGSNAVRLWGATRYDTSKVVAEASIPAGLDPAIVYVATGRKFPDALTAGPAAVGRNAVLLLIDGENLDGSPPAKDFLAQYKDRIAVIVMVGGESSITPTAVEQMRAIVDG